MIVAVSLEAAFLAALDQPVRDRFENVAKLADTLANLRAAATTVHPELGVDAATFAAELARRLGALASPDQLARVRADHVHLAIACAAGDELAIRVFEREFFDEVAATGARMRARDDQVDDVRGHLRRVLYVAEPSRPSGLSEYSGRGDLRSYVRVIVTRELVRVIHKGRREVGVADDDMLAMLSPTNDPELDYLRDRYRADVNAAMRAALVTLTDESRALLRYSLVDGWTVDRIGALYGIHRATAARRVAAARDELATAIRAELATRLEISVDDVDSIVRMVQSRIDVSLERLLG